MPAVDNRDLFDFKRVFVVLSNVCNCRCVMCNNRHHSLGRSSLTFDDVEQVARFALENQVEVLDFSGGEPFQFPHIARLIKVCAGSEMILNIVTNGTIMTSDHLKAIAEAPNLRLQVSTHGLGDVEDAIKRRPSASRQVDKTLGRLIDAGATVSLATVVQKQNLHQLGDIYRHFSALPYSHHSFVMYEPMGDTPEHIDPTDVRITPDRAEELRTQMTTVIDEARADGKVINLDPALVEKYVERVLTESPLSATRARPETAAAADTPLAADAALARRRRRRRSSVRSRTPACSARSRGAISSSITIATCGRASTSTGKRSTAAAASPTALSATSYPRRSTGTWS